MQHHSERLEYGAKIVLYIIAVLLPIWFIPYSAFGVEAGRELTFGLLIILAAILWMLSVLTAGEMRFPFSPVWYGAGLFVLALGASALFSKMPYVSMFFADASAEKMVTVLLGAALMAVAASVLKTREEAGRVAGLLLISATIAGVVSAAQLFTGFSLYKYIAPFAGDPSFNVVGTVNGLALFYGALLVLTLGLLVGGRKGAVSLLLIIPVLVFLLNLILINFLTGWIVLLGTAIILFGLIFKDVRKSRAGFDWRYWAALGFLVLAVVMIMVRSPWIETNLPAEVSPSLRATLGIGRGVYGEGVKGILLGSGPGTFGLDWARYKDPSINQTAFWDIRFNQGSSWFSTLIPTAGVLGALAFLVLAAGSAFLFLKILLERRGEEDAFSTAVFLGWISVVLAAFLYPANLTLFLVFFLGMGMLLTLLKNSGRGFWAVREEGIALDGPWAVFLSSLVIILLLSLGVARFYMNAGQVRSALALERGRTELSRGNFDAALRAYERAARSEPGNFRINQQLVLARTEEIRDIIRRATQGENVQQEFQQAVSLAIQDSQRALQLAPEEPALWRTQGALYELIIPFIQGAEKFAFESYGRAAELHPLNPGIQVERGRAALAYADRLQLLMNQVSGSEREQAGEARKAALEEAVKAFTKAVDIKSDLAAAHFLLAQTALRAGDAKQAIASAEKARDSAPFDIGVAFQLGLLYYQQDELGKARSEFDRAVALNQNYSNARYFLGLIYDRQGEKTRAIEEFEKVAVFNPDNQEVEKILANLRAGKQALDGIAPPGVPPEQRSEAPIR